MDIDPNVTLSDYMKIWLKGKKRDLEVITYESYAFTWEDGKPYDSDYISKLFKRAAAEFGRPLNIYSHFYRKRLNTSENDLQEISRGSKKLFAS